MAHNTSSVSKMSTVVVDEDDVLYLRKRAEGDEGGLTFPALVVMAPLVDLQDPDVLPAPGRMGVDVGDQTGQGVVEGLHE